MAVLVPKFRMVVPGGGVGSFSSAKSAFFNPQAIRDPVLRANQTVLSLFGRDVRQADRKSIKPSRLMRLSEMSPKQRRWYRRQQEIAKREGRPAPKKPRTYEPSSPGEAPRQGPDDTLRRFIFYVYDPQKQSVVIGAARLSGTEDPDAPETLEHGGSAEITYGPDKGKGKRIRVEARPHTTPAYEKMKPKLSQLWRNRVTG